MADETNRKQILNFPPERIVGEKYKIISSGEVQSDGMAVPLGSGGSSVVYKAEQSLSEGRSLFRAIKFFVFRDDVAKEVVPGVTTPISAVNFKDEMNNITSFTHQNILKAIDAGLLRLERENVTHEIPFLVTEFIDGQTLKDAIEQKTFQDAVEKQPELLIELIAQICRGVTHLHSRNFYHCDIAPKNIFLRGNFPELELIIGDLGVGRSIKNGGSDSSQIRITGSKSYCPDDIKGYLNKEVTFQQFREFQPRWDLYAVAKTAFELIDGVLGNTQKIHQPWLRALMASLESLTTSLRNKPREGSEFATVLELGEYVEWVHPVQRTILRVPEISENPAGTERWLIPIEAVVTSPRIRVLALHPAMLRLKDVPQLMMTSKIEHRGNHDRYEHSLGIYQNMRRYLLSLLNDPEFIRVFRRPSVELALIAGLLSNITWFPFSIIIQELHSRDRTLFKNFSRANIFDALSTMHTPSLQEEIKRLFPEVDEAKLTEILIGKASPYQDAGTRIIKFLLSSSIDARVIDYIRRDSLHLGISQGEAFDIDDLFQHIRIRNGGIVVTASGLTVVEQIITLRYWLHDQIYWSSSNRNIFAMLKFVLMSLHKEDEQNKTEFLSTLRGQVLESTQETLLEFFLEAAQKAGRTDIVELCKFILEKSPRLFVQALQFTRAEDDAAANALCELFENLYPREEMQLQEELNQRLIERFDLPQDRVHILLDFPTESGKKKIGEDINIQTHRKDTRMMGQLSGITEGVEKSFNRHLRRLRVFMHPETHKQLQERLQEVEDIVRLLG